MPNYIRAHCPGGTFFFTVVPYNRNSFLKPLQSRRILGHAWIAEMRSRPFTLEAICLLRDHLHFIMSLPEGDDDYSLRKSAIKTRFTKMFLKANISNEYGVRYRRKGERSVWQMRFWEHMIRDDEDFWHHVDYIHYNPVKHDLVTRVRDWPWPSFHQYVRMSIYTSDWAEDLSSDNVGIAVIGE